MRDFPIGVGAKFRGLLTAAVAGLAMYATLAYATDWLFALLCQWWFGTWPGQPWGSAIVLQMAIGPFFAIPLCVVVGLPVWTVADRYLPRTGPVAAQIGMLVGTLVGVATHLLGLDPGPSVGFFGVDQPATIGWWLPLSIDGWPGIWNRAMVVADIARLAVTGIVAGRVARHIALGVPSLRT